MRTPERRPVAESKIEWCTTTWNPIRGCSRVSPGCEHCYAERMAHRLSGPGRPYEGLTRKTSKGPVWTGEVRLVEEVLEQPLKWKKPRMVFVNSMSDLFHDRVPLEFLRRVFDVMAEARRHTFQILTKRHHRLMMFDLGGFAPWPSNVWMGVSVENAEFVHRIRALQCTLAKLKFLSLEPLLGPLPNLNLDGIHWVIVGGESGPGARPMHLEWVRDIRDQCAASGTALFIKQLGARAYGRYSRLAFHNSKAADPSEWPEDLRIRQWPEVGRA